MLMTAFLLCSSGVVSAKSTTTRLVAKELAGAQPARSGKKGRKGPLSAVQRRAMTQGYLVADQANYQRLKDKAQEKARKSSHQSAGRGRPLVEGLLGSKAA